MRSSVSCVVVGTVAALLVCSSALAHHGAASIYDMTKETTIKATVTEYVWTNPHVELGISLSGGTTTELLLELGSPPNIRNRGWTSRLVKAGDAVTVTFHPGLRGAKIGVVIKLVTADGKELHA
jgi:ABC-type Fe3+-hydroxamate transport system substrate-binding protein